MARRGPSLGRIRPRRAGIPPRATSHMARPGNGAEGEPEQENDYEPDPPLAGARYPAAIPIRPEGELDALVRETRRTIFLRVAVPTTPINHLVPA